MHTETVTQVSDVDQLMHALEHSYINQNVGGDFTHAPTLITNQPSNSLDFHLRNELKTCDSFAMSVAFISASTFRNYKMILLNSNKSGIIYTSTMNYFNKPEVFAELQDLSNRSNGKIECRIFNEDNRNFHPKGYSFEHRDHQTVIIGSSNLTNSALNSNYEWNIKFSSLRNGDIVYKVQDEFDFQKEHSEPITIEWIDKYRQDYEEFAPRTVKEIAQTKSIKPNLMQAEALENIRKIREAGQNKALLISATGTGKTILSALDVKQFIENNISDHERENASILFVAHTNTILRQAKKSFQLVLGGAKRDFGLLGGGKREFYRRFVFANIASLRDKAESELNHFDYVVIDETHRAGAESYQNLLSKIAPKFLLGMTATPERTDGADIFKDFDYNIAYEIRLRKALDNNLLCPFHYYGVADLELVDDNENRIEVLASEERVENILSSIDKYSQKGIKTKGLIFCSRNEEASRLSEIFNSSSNGYRTVALSGANPEKDRKEAISDLSEGLLDYIFVVDIFNEGADIPEVNLVVMLRQTQSSIIFTQQLGRGLRKNRYKEDLVVIDFIGNYSNNYLIPIALNGKTPPTPADLRREITEMEVPSNNGGYSSVYFDEIAKSRVLESIENATLSNRPYIKSCYKTLQDRLNRKPMFYDFWKYDFIDQEPRLIVKHFSNLVELEEYVFGTSGTQSNDFSDEMVKFLTFLSTQFINGKRSIECKILNDLLKNGVHIINECENYGNVFNILNKEFFFKLERNRFGDYPVIECQEDGIHFTDEVSDFLSDSTFKEYVEDVIKTALAINHEDYADSNSLVINKTYSRRDACRMLNWENNEEATIFGYKTKCNTTPIFVNLNIGEDHGAAVRYEDAFISPKEFIWYSRTNRTTDSREIKTLIDTNINTPHLFVQKSDDNRENSFYYLGGFDIAEIENTQKPDRNGNLINLVKMRFTFKQEISEHIFNYLTDNGENVDVW